MNYNYEIRTEDDSEIFSMKLPENLKVVSSYLFDIDKMGEWVLEGIVEVLSGKSDSAERDGNFFGCQIRKNFAKIADLFEQGYWCEIETIELKELVEIWIAEKRKFDKK